MSFRFHNFTPEFIPFNLQRMLVPLCQSYSSQSLSYKSLYTIILITLNLFFRVFYHSLLLLISSHLIFSSQVHSSCTYFFVSLIIPFLPLISSHLIYSSQIHSMSPSNFRALIYIMCAYLCVSL